MIKCAFAPNKQGSDRIPKTINQSQSELNTIYIRKGKNYACPQRIFLDKK